jgi:transposase
MLARSRAGFFIQLEQLPGPEASRKRAESVDKPETMNTTNQTHTVQAPVYCGIDIAKNQFDADLGGKIRQFDNTPNGIKKFFAALPADSHLVMEATGHYHLQLVDLAHQAGIALSVINPAWIKNFSRSGGKRAKTDPIDAATITTYARAFKPAPAVALSESLKVLREMYAVRESLIGMRVALQNQKDRLTDRKLRSMIQAQIKTLLKKEEQIDARMAETVNADQDLKAKSEVLRRNKGVGPQCATTLLCELPELGTIGRKNAAALAGVAPYNNDSGKFQGKRRIAGGRKKVRNALYMSALSASRYNPTFAKLKEKMKAEGKASKVILIAIARRLVVILNAQIRDHMEQLNLQKLTA